MLHHVLSGYVSIGNEDDVTCNNKYEYLHNSQMKSKARGNYTNNTNLPVQFEQQGSIHPCIHKRNHHHRIRSSKFPVVHRRSRSHPVGSAADAAAIVP